MNPNKKFQMLVLAAAVAALTAASATIACTRCCKKLNATAICPVVEVELRSAAAIEML